MGQPSRTLNRGRWMNLAGAEGEEWRQQEEGTGRQEACGMAAGCCLGGLPMHAAWHMEQYGNARPPCRCNVSVLSPLSDHDGGEGGHQPAAEGCWAAGWHTRAAVQQRAAQLHVACKASLAFWQQYHH